MPTVTFLDPAGAPRPVAARAGLSVMQAALKAGVPGIDADCGGALACATCHVYVAPEWLAATGAPSEEEEAMLDLAHDPRPNSRLSCQLVLTDALDGLVVRVPARQA